MTESQVVNAWQKANAIHLILRSGVKAFRLFFDCSDSGGVVVVMRKHRKNIAATWGDEAATSYYALQNSVNVSTCQVKFTEALHRHQA